MTVTLDVPWKQMELLFQAMPDATFYHLRDTIGAVFGSHRREFLARADANIKGHGARGLRVQKLDSRKGVSGGFAGQRSFFYRVYPRSKKRGTKTLNDISASSFTQSPVALGLERGGTVRPKRSRFLALPTGVTLDKNGRPKAAWRTPAKFRRGKKPKSLVALPRKVVEGGNNENLTLFWRKKVGKKEVLLPAYTLVPVVKKKKRLHYMRTWDSMRADRDRRFKRAIRSIISDTLLGVKRG